MNFVKKQFQVLIFFGREIIGLQNCEIFENNLTNFECVKIEVRQKNLKKQELNTADFDPKLIVREYLTIITPFLFL